MALHGIGASVLVGNKVNCDFGATAAITNQVVFGVFALVVEEGPGDRFQNAGLPGSILATDGVGARGKREVLIAVGFEVLKRDREDLHEDVAQD